MKKVNRVLLMHLTQVLNKFLLEKDIKMDTKIIRLSLWDTAGQEQFNSLAPIYYRDANGAILVYDISFRESFDKVLILINKISKWIRELK